MNEIMPSRRGLRDAASPTTTSTSVDSITKIISYGSGYIIVRMNDGRNYKRTGGTLAWRHNNPGNLKYGDFARKYGAIGPGYGQHAVFPTKIIGQKAHKSLLFSSERGYNKLSILSAIKKYAPTADGNNPTRYARYIASKLNVSVNTKLYHLSSNKQDQMIIAMEAYEGYKVGKVIPQ